MLGYQESSPVLNSSAGNRELKSRTYQWEGLPCVRGERQRGGSQGLALSTWLSGKYKPSSLPISSEATCELSVGLCCTEHHQNSGPDSHRVYMTHIGSSRHCRQVRILINLPYGSGHSDLYRPAKSAQCLHVPRSWRILINDFLNQHLLASAELQRTAVDVHQCPVSLEGGQGHAGAWPKRLHRGVAVRHRLAASDARRHRLC